MPVKPYLIVIIGVGLGLLAGCTSPDAPQENAASSDTADSSASVAEQPRSQLGAGEKQGDTSLSQLRSYESPADFPFSFTTDYPSDMRPQRIERGVGETIRFLNVSSGSAQPAAVEFHLYPAGMTQQEAQRLVRSKAEGFGQVKEASTYSWSLAEYTFQGSVYEGRIALGERADLFYYYMATHPVGKESNIDKKAKVILDHWQWDAAS